MQNEAGHNHLVDCPTRLTIEIVTGKWSVLVLHALSGRSRRHGELIDLIGGISRKVLTDTLGRLADYGLIERRAHTPRNVEYRLTALGQTLIEPIEVLTDWARDNAGAIVDFQEAHAARA
ncbi:winged helix-turn-helix transcriptional regulator [Microbacterium sp. MAHUQ-60]|uniref:winged helix-turn-helix transcriptional regulator n=1 Tax=unclassified Microbacterium TaxID=2609290 RepID=UPI0036216092